MNKYLVGAVFLLFAFTAGFWASAYFTDVATVRAQSDRDEHTIVVKWEYCTVSRAKFANSNRTGVYWISYFRENGVQVVEFEDAATEKNGATRIIAKLGSEGWELVGQAPLDIRQGAPVDALYFKRPKP